MSASTSTQTAPEPARLSAATSTDNPSTVDAGTSTGGDSAAATAAAASTATAAATSAAPSGAFAGKLVLITGSTAGIGRGIAEHFAKAGARTVVNGRSSSSVDKAVEEISKLDGVTGWVYGAAGDVGTAEGCEQVVAAVNALGELDILVNNTGVYEVKDFTETTDEDWLRMFEVNVLSAVRLVRSFLPRMLARNKGRVINIASEAGYKPLPHMLPYSTSKTAMLGMSRGMAELTKGSRVTVNSVAAGPTWTPGVEVYCTDLARAQGVSLDTAVSEYFKRTEPTSLIQRFLTIDEIAAGVMFLASDGASGVNGSSLRLEGGTIRCV